MDFLILIIFFAVQSIETAIERLPSITINEQISIGTSISDLTRLYPAKNFLRFAFLSETSSHNSFFMIDSLTGRISIKRMIDREELCQRQICQCDRCVLTLEIVVTSETIDILALDIVVENINDHRPTFPLAKFEIRLSETTDVGHVSLFPAATDLDWQNHLEYRLIPLDDSSGVQTFSLVHFQTENQLGLRLLKNVDREQRNLYQFRIEVTDGEHRGELFLDVHILDSNDNVPKFDSEQYQIEVREDIPLNTVILRVQALDNDQGLNALINYTIVSNSFPFQINETTGQITLIYSLDYEKETTYQFTVRAKDNGIDAISVYAQIHIDVIDVNDCPPEIDFIFPDLQSHKEILFIEEEKEIQTRLFHISVTDKDSINDKIQLQLLNYQDRFQLHEQYKDLYSFIVRHRLDRETQEEYRLIFQATDQSNRSEQVLTSEKQLTIILTDINDCRPIVDPYPKPLTINENNPPNVRLIQFHARDGDAWNSSNSRLSYSLVQSNDSHLFSIESETGILSVKNISFDYESKSIYHLILNISDHGEYPRRLETLEHIEIHIANLNDHPLKFQQEFYLFSLAENCSIGVFVGQVKATDIDVNTTITYEIESTDEQSATFHIDRYSGEIFTETLLDFETKSIYHLRIVARDTDEEYFDYTNVTIHLLDLNDNAPIVDTPSSLYISSEIFQSNQSIPLFVTHLLAFDRDEGQNANLTYEILDGNSNDAFEINRFNGTVLADPARLEQGYHRLTIHVCDQGQHQIHCSIATINIKVGEHVEQLFYSTSKTDQIEMIDKKSLPIYQHILTREILLVVLISSLFTVMLLIVIGITCAFVCRRKKYHPTSCQSNDADQLLSINIGATKKLTEEQLDPAGNGIHSEDSCYGSHDLSRSSSNIQAVVRPLLTLQDRSSSLSSTSIDDHHHVQEILPLKTNYLTTFSSPQRTFIHLLRKDKKADHFNSTYVPYDSVDVPPPSLSKHDKTIA